MRLFEKLRVACVKYMAILIVLVCIFALLMPDAVSFIKTSYITPLLMLIMFGMGLSMKADDFKMVFQKPKIVLIGLVAQFSIMPLIGFLLCLLFALPTDLAIGVMLVGSSPGGTSSNVMTYLAKGDLVLSVSMTSLSTVLAPVLTPLLILFYLGTTITVDIIGMFFSIIQVVIVPIVLGLFINKFFTRLAHAIQKSLPMVSVLSIAAIVACVVGINAAKIMHVGFFIIGIVILHNLLGYLLGYMVAKLCKMNAAQQRAVCIEVGMQNSGLATSLATIHFATMPLAAVAGAMFSVWHNISGSILANYFTRDNKN